MEPLRYRFRPGALEHIQRTRNLYDDSQLCAALGVTAEGLAKIRAGSPVTAKVALHASALQGNADYIGALFDVYEPQVA